MKSTTVTVRYRFVVAACLLLLGGCASGPPVEEGYAPPIYEYQRIVPEGVVDVAAEAYDPWEGMNRRIYNFNYHFDRYVFLPVSNGYKRVVPGFARTGVTNFFDNIRDVNTLANSILQLKAEKAAQATGRVLVNTTIGLLGLIDVASYMGIPQPAENFGDTLGRWGVGPGPYLVLPLLGPSSLRDGIGTIPDSLLRNAIYQEYIPSGWNDYMFLLDAIDTRSRVNFRYFETGSAFEYETVRWLYSTKRELDVAK
jgi:phospholipid-binding lipoprotein MlaA